MFSKHPLRIVSGISDWQVLQRTGNSAVASLSFERDLANAPGAVYLRLVNEHSGEEQIPWIKIADDCAAAWGTQLAVPTGGPYRLETCVKAEDTEFKDALAGDFRLHVFAGDVYLIAGQSNAVGYAREPCADPAVIGVSVYRQSGKWDLASHPLHDGTDSIYKNLDVPAAAHSPWLAFAKTVFRTTGVPIGLIPAALGGSPMPSWVPGAVLYENALQMVRDAGGICGVLWYQGCADVLSLDTERYLQRFFAMVEGLRSALAQPDLPFYTCQLNGFTEPGTAADDQAWTELRALQLRAAEQAGIHLLATAGMELYDQIHNSAASNLRIGRQVAAQVLQDRYGVTASYAPPECTAAVRCEDCLILTFAPAYGGLRLGRRAKDAFAVWAGETRLPITRVEAQGNQLYLYGAVQTADRVTFGYRQNMELCAVTDRKSSMVLAPFCRKLQ